MASKFLAINHFKALKEAFENIPLAISLDCNTFVVSIKSKNKIFRLIPTFTHIKDGLLQYTAEFSPNIIRFVGWRPYPSVTVKPLVDKITTKELLSKHDILLPRWSMGDDEFSSVIVKRRKSSFADGIHGPYHDTQEYELIDALEEYFEEFIEGEIVKVWYYNENPAYIELQEMPTLIGDGKHTIDDLIQIRAAIYCMEPKYDQINEVLRFHDKNYDTILDPYEELMIDFRYASVMSLPDAIDEYPLPADDRENDELQFQLAKIGKAAYSIIQPEVEHDLVYTVDGILTDNNELYTLEINVNPEVHPYMYKLMAKAMNQQADSLKSHNVMFANIIESD